VLFSIKRKKKKEEMREGDRWAIEQVIK